MLHLAHDLIAVFIDILKLGLLCLRSNSAIASLSVASMNAASAGTIWG
jgi:hypothetical protein